MFGGISDINKGRFFALTYVIVLTVISRTPILNEGIFSFLAIPAVLIFLQQIGETSIGVLYSFRHSQPVYFSLVSRTVIEVISGLVLFFAAVLLLSNLPLWSFDFFLLLILGILVFRSLFLLFKNKNKYSYSIDFELRKCFGSFRPLVITIAIGVVSALMIYVHIPYPLTLDPNSSSYTFVALQIRDGNTMNVGLGHAPVIPLVAATASGLSCVHPLGIMYAVPFFIHVLFSIAIYIFAYKLVKEQASAVAAAAIGVFLSVNCLNNFDSKPLFYLLLPFWLYLLYEQFSSSDNIRIVEIMLEITLMGTIAIIFLFKDFFLPSIANNLIIFVLVLSVIIAVILRKTNEVSKQIFLSFAFFSMFVSMLNSFEAPLLMVFICAVMITLVFMNRQFNFVKPTCLVLIAILVFILLQVTGILSFESNFTFSRLLWGDLYNQVWFDMNAAQKLAWITGSINLLALILSILGVIVAIFSRRKNAVPLVIILGIMYFLIFLPEGHFWRVRDYTEPISAIMIVLALAAVWKLLANSIKRIARFRLASRVDTHAYSYSVYFLIALILLIPSFCEPKLLFENSIIRYNPEGTMSYIRSYDIQAAFWIYSHTPKTWVRPLWWTSETQGFETTSILLTNPILRNETREIRIPLTNDTFIISDPYTMFLLQGYTGRDIAIDERVFTYEQEYSQESIQRMKQVKDIFFSISSQSAFEKIGNLGRNHKTILIVFNERTFTWLQQKSEFILFPPSIRYMYHPYIFDNPHFFTVVFTIPRKLYIWQVRNEVL